MNGLILNLLPSFNQIIILYTEFDHIFIILSYFSGEDECMNICSKRMKTDIQNHNHIQQSQMPDLIRDAYDFDENRVEGTCHSSYSSSNIPLKE